MNKLFVYGTLGPGRPNEHILKKIGGAFQRAFVKGKLLDEGWGATMGYPGIQLDSSAAPVEGFLFISENLKSHWDFLDSFEGVAYQRVLTEVELSDSTITEAYIYVVMKK